MKQMLTTPSGTISMPNSRTSHGIVRQRRLSPIMPVLISSTLYGRAQSSIGDRPCLGYPGRDNTLRTAAKKGIPSGVDMTKLVSGEVTRDKQVDEHECNDRHAVGPF